LALNVKSEVATDEKGKTYLRREKALSTFHRRTSAGERIDMEKSSASTVANILGLNILKLWSEPEKRIRRLTL
jgi:HSP20 family molecular chaperone IbpA